MSKPRSEIFYPAVQTASDKNYVPKPTRDEKRAELFSGKTGIVIPWQQKIGTIASARAFNRIAQTGNEENIKNISNLLALTSFGTAYHVFAERDADRVMYRRAKIPTMINPDTKERTSQDDLLVLAQGRLAEAADLAIGIEQACIDGRSLRGKSHMLGRVFAPAAATLATIEAGVADMDGNEKDMQWHAWQAAQGSYLRMLELSGKLDARPTVAQLADEHAPLRRFMNDDQHFVNKVSHKTLLEEIEEAKKSPSSL
ncbi:MAG TPA: hypothetical protein VGE34_02540 [Candidatus Saccharimonadales bacterium]